MKPVDENLTPVQNGGALLLRVFSPGGQLLFEKRIEKSPVRFGRSLSQDVVISDPEISKNHLQLEWNEKEVRAEDLSSRNGLYVHHERVSASAFNPSGFEFYLGHHRVVGRVLPQEHEVTDSIDVEAFHSQRRAEKRAHLAVEGAVGPKGWIGLGGWGLVGFGFLIFHFLLDQQRQFALIFSQLGQIILATVGWAAALSVASKFHMKRWRFVEFWVWMWLAVTGTLFLQDVFTLYTFNYGSNYTVDQVRDGGYVILALLGCIWIFSRVFSRIKVWKVGVCVLGFGLVLFGIGFSERLAMKGENRFSFESFGRFEDQMTLALRIPAQDRENVNSVLEAIDQSVRRLR